MMAFVHVLFAPGSAIRARETSFWRVVVGGDALETGSVCVTYWNGESGTHPTKSHGAKGRNL